MGRRRKRVGCDWRSEGRDGGEVGRWVGCLVLGVWGETAKVVGMGPTVYFSYFSDFLAFLQGKALQRLCSSLGQPSASLKSEIRPDKTPQDIRSSIAKSVRSQPQKWPSNTNPTPKTQPRSNRVSKPNLKILTMITAFLFTS